MQADNISLKGLGLERHQISFFCPNMEWLLQKQASFAAYAFQQKKKTYYNGKSSQ